MRLPGVLLTALLHLAAGSATATCLTRVEGCDEVDAAASAVVPSRDTLFASAALPGSRGLLSSLETFLRERAVDMNGLDAEGMVTAMTEWFHFAPAPPGTQSDALVFRYGGWSEGCATGFKLSLLRRIVPRGGEDERLAGITLLFEPASLSGIAPATFASPDASSLQAFVDSVRASPAFKRLTGVTPMSAMLENGALR